MTEPLVKLVEALSPEKRALLRKLLDPRPEPIAIVGMGCRFPGGVDTIDDFWRLLLEERDATSEVPLGRWDASALHDPDPSVPGRTPVRRGGFVSDLESFDAGFFGISPAEATRMEPQQRLALEVTWQALEYAGQSRERLAGSRSGTYFGVVLNDFATKYAPSLEELGVYDGTGNALNVITGRIAYLLDLRGPAVTIDTACSSSLVAVHMACRALRLREIDLAIAGGANAILLPHLGLILTRMGALAPDGRCKTFDDRADGFVRSEGAGAVVLKRLADAMADDDPILAVIRGSAVNHDGRSVGLTAPNALSQQAVLRAALEDGGVRGAEIDYVETHGTGTPLGDPIEIESLAAVIGVGRENGSRCVLGAVKTNIGHLEAAAGIAGLIKAALCLQRQAIPPNLHFEKPNPHCALAETPFEIPTKLCSWRRGERKRFAGVSAFSLSGTNAHVVLEEAPVIDGSPGELGEGSTPFVLPLSTQSPQALVELARRTARWVEAERPCLRDVVYTASCRRSHYAHRLAVVAETTEQLAEGLRQFAAGTPADLVATGVAPGRRRIAAIFSGQGSQWVGMGRELLATEAVFREAVERCTQVFSAIAGLSPREELERSEKTSRLAETAVAQPALFAVQVGLAALWRRWGIEPEAVAGHSLGEVTAAYVAGCLSLEDAVRVVFHRSRLMQQATGQGTMVSLEAPEERVAPALRGLESEVAIAAYNAPTAVVIAGTVGAVQTVVERLTAEGVRHRALRVDYAFHSPQMERLRGELEESLADLSPTSGRIPLVSTVTGEVIDGTSLRAGYWARNLREPVRFAAAIDCLRRRGYGLFLEVGAHPVLGAAIAESAEATSPAEDAAVVVGSLRRNRAERETLLGALGTLYATGCAVEWAAVQPTGRVVSLPPYPWQRERYWPEPERSARNEWVYELEWREAAEGPEASAEAIGRTLIIEDEGEAGAGLAAECEVRGVECVRASPGGQFERCGVGRFRVRVDSEEDLARLLNEGPFDAVVHLASLDAPAGTAASDLLAAQTLGCMSGGALVRACLASKATPRIWLVTRGTQAVAAGEGVAHVAQAPFWGFGRALALEHPDLWGGLVDLDPRGGAREAGMLADHVAAGGREDHVAFREGRVYVARLVGLSAARPAPQRVVVRSDATYLLTGGLGGLGLEVARWLVEKGARHLTLVGRSGATTEEARAAMRDLEGRGVAVRVVRADVGDADSLAQVFAEVDRQGPPLAGVMHLAAVWDEDVVARGNAASFVRAFRPKAVGAWNLHQLTEGRPLDFFVLFSSVSAWASMGLSNYASANAFLDALAVKRRALDLPALSVSWGAWADSGAAAALGGEYQRRMEGLGLGFIPVHDGLTVLEALMSEGIAHAVVAPLDWTRYAEALPNGAPPLLADLTRDAQRGDPGAERLRYMGLAECAAWIETQVRALVAEVLGAMTAAEIDPDRPLAEIGVDSLSMMVLRSKLRQQLGVGVPIRALLQDPTVRGIAVALTSIIRDSEVRNGAPPAAEQTPPAMRMSGDGFDTDQVSR